MVPILAKQAVKIKCGFTGARLTGNYELAYSLGILSASAGIGCISGYASMQELKEMVLLQTEAFTTDDEKLNNMIGLLKEYEPSDSFDDQMKELYEMGFADRKM